MLCYLKKKEITIDKAAKISSKGKENFSVTLEDEEMPRMKFCRKMPMILFL